MPNPYQSAAGVPALLDDPGHIAVPFWHYVFMAAAGSSLVTGYFSDPYGIPIQNALGTGYVYAATIGQTPVTLLVALGMTVVPTNAVGFIGQLIGSPLAFCPGSPDFLTVNAILAADMKAKPGQYPMFTATSQFRLGRA